MSGRDASRDDEDAAVVLVVVTALVSPSPPPTRPADPGTWGAPVLRATPPAPDGTAWWRSGLPG